MRIVVAPDSFKGCLTALEVCNAVERGLQAASDDIQVTKVPMADGGEGTVQSLVDATGGRFISRTVEGPLGDPVSARLGMLGDGHTAVVEMAAASGLPLLAEDQQDPARTTTYGTGQLIAAALDHDCSQLIVGIGGSATTDGGAPMAQALGARMLDCDGDEIPRVSGGRLTHIHHIDISRLDSRLNDVEVRVACDVDNPLFGENGAAHVYSPQKGASEADVEMLDRGLRHYARILKRDLGADISDVPGAGAAGGLGAGLMAFCNATLQPGIDIVLETVGLREKAEGADLIITAEGKIDKQTAFGKTPMAAAKVGARLHIPVIAIAGSVEPGARQLYDRNLAAVFSITTGPMSLQKAIQSENAEGMIAFTAENILRLLIAHAKDPTADHQP